MINNGSNNCENTSQIHMRALLIPLEAQKVHCYLCLAKSWIGSKQQWSGSTMVGVKNSVKIVRLYLLQIRWMKVKTLLFNVLKLLV